MLVLQQWNAVFKHHDDPASQMRLLSAIAFLTLFAVAFAADAAPLPAPHQVDIPSAQRDFARAALQARRRWPVSGRDRAARLRRIGRPFRAGAAALSRLGRAIAEGGKAVLLPDSYGSRELGPQCRVKERRIRARRERVADIMASRQWLVQQPWAARDRISLMGWANGASALLWAVRPQLPSRNIEPDFRSAIAFYPNCRISSGLGWSARVPTLLLDRRQRRRQFAAGLPSDGRRRARAQRAGADRGLSRRLSRFRPRQSSAARDCRRPRMPPPPEHGHLGTDPEARADSQKRVAEWLAR